MAKFNFGQLTATRAVAERFEVDKDFKIFVTESFQRFIECDWGDVCDEDKALNDNSVINGERLLGSYTANDGTKIWIITEWDRSYTTILFPNEY